MRFRDITLDTETLYTFEENEKAVFFMLNRDGEIEFDLAAPGAETHIFALFVEKDSEKNLSLTQKHSARDTSSHATVRSVIGNAGAVNYTGLIRIEEDAIRSDASQESRALLLSSGAKHSTKPSLEILPKDVVCHHKASATPLNNDSLFYLESRGLNRKDATAVLVNGFLSTTFEAMRDLGVAEESLNVLEQNVLSQLLQLYA